MKPFSMHVKWTKIEKKESFLLNKLFGQQLENENQQLNFF